jgi:pyruvate formate lyase activating enzyme
VELLPFHTLGSEKYPSLGREYPMAGTRPPSKEMLDVLHDILMEHGLSVHIMN